MSDERERHKWIRLDLIRIILFLFLGLFCQFGEEIFLGTTQARAADVELLTPRSGATVIARNPLTHLVLRQAGSATPSRVKVEKSGAVLDPIVKMDDGEHLYLHFRLPLEPGRNTFTIIPSGQRVELNFRQIRASLNPKSFAGGVDLFHRDDQLPESCQECHDLKETDTLEPVGLQQQTSCPTCHRTIIEKGPWKHGPVVNRQCLVCHQRSVKPWRIGFPATKIQDLCVTCHTYKKDWESRKFIHGPMIVGGCTLCHDPHGGKYRYQLWAAGSLQLCITCHSDKRNLVSKKKKQRPAYVHGIIYGEGCVVCHSPHATDERYMLSKPINELCTGCHHKLAGVKRGHPVAGHPTTAPQDPRRPGRRLVCSSCHNPHGSSYQYMLINTLQGARLCRGCHRR
jgi:predicted CXXCH cytochrome family protein